MGTNRIEPARATAAGTFDERRRRIAWEAERLAEAYSDIAAGRVVDEADVDASACPRCPISSVAAASRPENRLTGAAIAINAALRGFARWLLRRRGEA